MERCIVGGAITTYGLVVVEDVELCPGSGKNEW